MVEKLIVKHQSAKSTTLFNIYAAVILTSYAAGGVVLAVVLR